MKHLVFFVFLVSFLFPAITFAQAGDGLEGFQLYDYNDEKEVEAAPKHAGVSGDSFDADEEAEAEREYLKQIKEEEKKKEEMNKKDVLILKLKNWFNSALVIKSIKKEDGSEVNDALIMNLEPEYLNGNSWKKQTVELCQMFGVDVWYLDITELEYDYYVNCNGVKLKRIADNLELFDNLNKFSQLRFDTQKENE